MAELAIPILALGGLYIISKNKNDDNNDNDNNLKENYQNLNNTKIINSYPNNKPVDENNINYYPNNNQSTDKYFSQDNYQKIANNLNKSESIKSMSGKNLDKSDFKHNNMVPFFGGKIKGSTADYNVSESILDNMQGNGSQQFSKQEIAPLFNPSDSMNYIYGTPNNTDFYQSRQVNSMKMSNTTPWDQIKVAPGLNDGYNTIGKGGLNAGNLSRELWQPKTVNELRVETNPKITYGLEGHQGPAYASVTNAGTNGKIEKRGPDTYYNLGPERWFTTTGQEKAPAFRSNQVESNIKSNCPVEYFGIANDSEGTYIKSNYENPNRPELNSNPIMHAHAKNNASLQKADLNKIELLPNNRSTVKNNEMPNIFGIGKAVIAPILDILKPTRKENVIGNARLNGNVNMGGSKEYVSTNINSMKITNRQITNPNTDLNHLNINATQNSDGYQITNHIPNNVQRDTTNYEYYMNPSGSNKEGALSTMASNNQRNNNNKIHTEFISGGCNEVYSPNYNVTNLKNDTIYENNRDAIINGGPSYVPSYEQLGHINNKMPLSEKNNNSRLDTDLLNAFKNNPYTQSLSSVA